MAKKFWIIFSSMMVVYFIATTALWFSDWSDSKYLIDNTPVPVKKKVENVAPKVLSKAELVAKQRVEEKKALAALKEAGGDDLAMMMGLGSGWDAESADKGVKSVEKVPRKKVGPPILVSATNTIKVVKAETKFVPKPKLTKQRVEEEKALAALNEAGGDDLAMAMGLESGWNVKPAAHEVKMISKDAEPKQSILPVKAVTVDGVKVSSQKAALTRVEAARSLFLNEAKALNAVAWQKYDNQTYLSIVEFRERLAALEGDELLGVEKELPRYQQKLRLGQTVVKASLTKELMETERVEAFTLGLKSFQAEVDKLSKVESWDFGAFHKKELVVAHLLAAVAKKAKRDTERESVKKTMAKVGLLKSKVAVIKKALKGLKPVKASEVDCTGLVAGSQAALDLQKRAASEAGYPLEVENSIGMRFRFIPAGKFMMGSPEREDGRDGDEKLHEVVITKPFYMSVTEVTTAEFSLRKGKGKAVVKLPFPRVEHFCLTLQAYEKTTDGAYLLPTEAQWEYACRAGLSNPCYATDRDKIANFGNTFGGGVVPVAGKLANPWGLYDMLGNVKEVCRDRDESSMWGAKVPKTYIDGIKDPLSTEGDSVVARGGGWESGKSDTRAASRELFHPDTKDWSMGFRVIRVLP